MNIRIKGIYPERTEDAPFIGALICANNCFFNCQDCINEHVKAAEGTLVKDTEIIKEVLKNPFNKGIILAGLEWTLQPKAMYRLIELALKYGLEVILYTGRDKDELFSKFPKLLNCNIYVKYGRYIKELRTMNNKQYGVYLASSNQSIIKIKNGKLEESGG